MIQTTVTVNTQPLAEAAEFFEHIQLEINRIGDDVQREIAPTLLSELAYYPGAVVHPFVWSTDATKNARARRYYFAAVRRGDIPTSGGGYARTGSYGRSWFVQRDTEADAFVLRVGSRHPAAQFIGGSLNQRSVGEAARWQIPGHSATGWPLQVTTVNYWIGEAQRLFIEAVIDRLEGLVAVTKTTRRSRR